MKKMQRSGKSIVQKNGQLSRKMDSKDLLEYFFEDSAREYHVRELAKLTRQSPTTVAKNLDMLKKKGLLQKRLERQHLLYKADNTSIFKTKKTNYYVEKIVASGLLDELIKKLNPSCIILFGSVRKGESVKESDIDLFIESHADIKVDAKKYEKSLKHKIQLFVEKDMNKLQPQLFNNVVNGIKLYGSFKIR